MKSKMSEPSIWSAVLRDIWMDKPRPYRPEVIGLSAKKLKEIAAHEVRLDRRLSSVFSPMLMRNTVVKGIIRQARFVPGSGGNYVLNYEGGRLELYSLHGDLLDSVETGDDAPLISRMHLRAISAHSAHLIQIRRDNV
jgi:hypothetical protein